MASSGLAAPKTDLLELPLEELARMEVGIRAGIEKSIESMRDATGIVESLSAEDIGKLPDISIADSLARLPGLADQRVGGRASTINIRGFSNDFGTTLLNGREQASVGQNRGVEFDQYPSELLNGVTVYKTPDAALVGQGLSGTVNLETVRPLDYRERVLAVNARLEENSKGELNPGQGGRGSRLSFSYIDQFADRTLGVALSVARLDSPGQSERFEAWGYRNDVDANGDGRNDFLLMGGRSQAVSSDAVRDGVMAVIEFAPNDNYRSTFDLYYSKFDIEETLRTVEAGLGASGATLSNAVVENGRVVAGTFTGVRPVLRNDLNISEDRIYSFGWKNELRINEQWQAMADLSLSRAHRDITQIETYAGLGASGDAAAAATVDFTLGPDGLPRFSYNRRFTDPQQIVLTDPAGWTQEGYEKYPHLDDRLQALRLGAVRDLSGGLFERLDLGVNFSEREKTRSSGAENILCLAPNPDGGSCLDAAGNYSNAEVAIPPGALTGPADLGFTGIPGSIGYDVHSVLGLYYRTPSTGPGIDDKNWNLSEKVVTAYGQLDIDTVWGDVPVRGNIGLQLLRTDQQSEGRIVGTAPVLRNAGGATYGNFLPSLNLAFDLAHEQVLRVAAAKQIARPRMDDMRANLWLGVSPAGQWLGFGGNPQLKPWEAHAYDFSYEKYFGKTGYVSAATFFKDLRSYIYFDTRPHDFSGIDTGTGQFPVVPASPVGELTAPVNGNGGALYGLELTVSVPFDLLLAALEGFGLQANYAHTKSEIDPLGPKGPPEPLPGLSEHVSNITLYFERAGFQARVSQRSRSRFLGEVQGFGGDRSKRYIDGEKLVDLQLGYGFAENSRLRGLSLLLQVNNLTDEVYREYFPDRGSLPQTVSEYGRTVLAGVNYKFK
jgi:iron complex outermembrane receptor protein